AVPKHLRDASYPGAAKLGHGEGYVYPHDAPAGWVPQQYRPSEVETRVYYRPGAQGREAELGELLERRRSRRQDDVEGSDAEADRGRGDGGRDQAAVLAPRRVRSRRRRDGAGAPDAPALGRAVPPAGGRRPAARLEHGARRPGGADPSPSGGAKSQLSA